MIVEPKTTGLIIYRKIDNSAGTNDQDLVLEMQSRSGEKCTVNYLNPDCPFAHYE